MDDFFSKLFKNKNKKQVYNIDNKNKKIKLKKKSSNKNHTTDQLASGQFTNKLRKEFGIYKSKSEFSMSKYNMPCVIVKKNSIEDVDVIPHEFHEKEHMDLVKCTRNDVLVDDVKEQQQSRIIEEQNTRRLSTTNDKERRRSTIKSINIVPKLDLNEDKNQNLLFVNDNFSDTGAESINSEFRIDENEVYLPSSNKYENKCKEMNDTMKRYGNNTGAIYKKIFEEDKIGISDDNIENAQGVSHIDEFKLGKKFDNHEMDDSSTMTDGQTDKTESYIGFEKDGTNNDDTSKKLKSYKCNHEFVFKTKEDEKLVKNEERDENIGKRLANQCILKSSDKENVDYRLKNELKNQVLEPVMDGIKTKRDQENKTDEDVKESGKYIFTKKGRIKIKNESIQTNKMYDKNEGISRHRCYHSMIIIGGCKKKKSKTIHSKNVQITNDKLLEFTQKKLSRESVRSREKHFNHPCGPEMVQNNTTVRTMYYPKAKRNVLNIQSIPPNEHTLKWLDENFGPGSSNSIVDYDEVDDFDGDSLKEISTELQQEHKITVAQEKNPLLDTPEIKGTSESEGTRENINISLKGNISENENKKCISDGDLKEKFKLEYQLGKVIDENLKLDQVLDKFEKVKMKSYNLPQVTKLTAEVVTENNESTLKQTVFESSNASKSQDAKKKIDLENVENKKSHQLMKFPAEDVAENNVSTLEEKVFKNNNNANHNESKSQDTKKTTELENIIKTTIKHPTNINCTNKVAFDETKMNKNVKLETANEVLKRPYYSNISKNNEGIDIQVEQKKYSMSGNEFLPTLDICKKSRPANASQSTNIHIPAGHKQQMTNEKKSSLVESQNNFKNENDKNPQFKTNLNEEQNIQKKVKRSDISSISEGTINGKKPDILNCLKTKDDGVTNEIDNEKNSINVTCSITQNEGNEQSKNMSIQDNVKVNKVNCVQNNKTVIVDTELKIQNENIIKILSKQEKKNLNESAQLKMDSELNGINKMSENTINNDINVCNHSQICTDHNDLENKDLKTLENLNDEVSEQKVILKLNNETIDDEIDDMDSWKQSIIEKTNKPKPKKTEIQMKQRQEELERDYIMTRLELALKQNVEEKPEMAKYILERSQEVMKDVVEKTSDNINRKLLSKNNKCNGICDKKIGNNQICAEASDDKRDMSNENNKQRKMEINNKFGPCEIGNVSDLDHTLNENDSIKASECEIKNSCDQNNTTNETKNIRLYECKIQKSYGGNDKVVESKSKRQDEYEFDQNNITKNSKKVSPGKFESQNSCEQNKSPIESNNLKPDERENRNGYDQNNTSKGLRPAICDTESSCDPDNIIKEKNSMKLLENEILNSFDLDNTIKDKNIKPIELSAQLDYTRNISNNITDTNVVNNSTKCIDLYDKMKSENNKSKNYCKNNIENYEFKKNDTCTENFKAELIQEIDVEIQNTKGVQYAKEVEKGTANNEIQNSENVNEEIKEKLNLKEENISDDNIKKNECTKEKLMHESKTSGETQNEIENGGRVQIDFSSNYNHDDNEIHNKMVKTQNEEDIRSGELQNENTKYETIIHPIKTILESTLKTVPDKIKEDKKSIIDFPKSCKGLNNIYKIDNIKIYRKDSKNKKKDEKTIAININSIDNIMRNKTMLLEEIKSLHRK